MNLFIEMAFFLLILISIYYITVLPFVTNNYFTYCSAVKMKTQNKQKQATLLMYDTIHLVN